MPFSCPSSARDLLSSALPRITASSGGLQKLLFLQNVLLAAEDNNLNFSRASGAAAPSCLLCSGSCSSCTQQKHFFFPGCNPTLIRKNHFHNCHNIRYGQKYTPAIAKNLCSLPACSPLLQCAQETHLLPSHSVIFQHSTAQHQPHEGPKSRETPSPAQPPPSHQPDHVCNAIFTSSVQPPPSQLLQHPLVRG